MTLAAPLAAQSLRVVVRDSATQQPVAGAVVMLRDSNGTVLRRGLTDDRGQYAAVRPATARSARVVRIGFEARNVPLPASTVGVTSLDVGMVPVRAILAPVQVTDQSRCPRRRDAAITAGLWEQARAGLLATVVAREANPATIHRLGFVRTMDGNSDRIARFSVASDSISSAGKSFLAASSAAGFVQSGFEKDSAGKRIVFAPDADVLLDDAFADAYCFRVAEPSRARPHDVGLAFAAADHPRGRVDIDGTLWVDTAARALRDIEFRYVGLPAWTDAFRPGGVVSFRQMANGVVLIDRWDIRNVVAVADTTRNLLMPNGDRGERAELNAVENGGEVAHAAWPDGQSWQAALGQIQVHVVGPRERPAAGTVIALAGTDYRGTADASGNAVVSDLLPGPYSVEVFEPRLATIGLSIPTPLTFVAVRDSTLQRTLTLPSEEQFAKSRCVAAAKRFAVGDSVFILGRVATSDRRPIAEAKVTSAVKRGSGAWRWQSGAYTTGTDGTFQVCTRGLALGDSVKVSVELTFEHAPSRVVETTRLLATNLTIVPVVANGASPPR